MMLNELQIKEIKEYLKKCNIENRLIFGDFLDHLCCMIEQKMNEGATFDDSLKKAFAHLPGSEIKSIELFTLKLLNMETTFSSRISLQATIPFVLFGLFWTFSNSDLDVPGVIQNILFLSSVISMFALLTVGWIKNFPRWSFPAIGFCLLFSLFSMNVASPPISDDILGFWAWIPLIITLIISQIFKPGVEPVKNIFKKTKDEPFLILFSIYGFTPFLVLMLSDEIHTNWMIPVAILTTLVLSSGIYLFLSCEKRVYRILSVVISGILAVVITYIASYLYWK
jgi:hypothetical protein